MTPRTIGALLDGSVARVRGTTGIPVVFAGPVDDDRLHITVCSGTRTGSLQGLLVERDQGLGGRAITLRRPFAVDEYRTSRVITHDFDREVEHEGLVSLLAVPVVAEDHVRGVLYGALRRHGFIGDSAIDGLTQCARQLGDDLLDRTPTSESHSERRTRLRAIVDAALQAAQEVPDASLRAAIRDCHARLTQTDPSMRGAYAPAPADAPRLTARQLDVLGLAAVDCETRTIAQLLNTTPASVKAHLRQAMHQLDVRTRHAAVSAARAHGLLT